MYLDYKLLASFRRVLESLSTLDATDDNPPRASSPNGVAAWTSHRNGALSAKPSSRGRVKSVLRVLLCAHSRWCLGAVVRVIVYLVNSMVPAMCEHYKKLCLDHPRSLV